MVALLPAPSRADARPRPDDLPHSAPGPLRRRSMTALQGGAVRDRLSVGREVGTPNSGPEARKGRFMNRRDFLRSAGVVSATFAFPKTARLFAEDSAPDSWRTFEVMTRVEVLKPSGPTLIWLPAALIRETPYQKTLANQFSAEGGNAEMVELKADALGIVAEEYAAGAPA